MTGMTLSELSTLSGVALYAVYEMPRPNVSYSGDPGDPDITDDVRDVPSPFYAKAREIADQADEAVCEDDGTTPIGYVLHEDDVDPLSGGWQWRAPWLIIGPSGAVGAVCEDCAPYDATPPVKP